MSQDYKAWTKKPDTLQMAFFVIDWARLLGHLGQAHNIHPCPGVYKLGQTSFGYKHRKISNIRRTKSPNLNVSSLVLQLSLSNSVKPGVKSRMKM